MIMRFYSNRHWK